jgi:RNA polymerase sigma-70 factor (ECF subfamily)
VSLKAFLGKVVRDISLSRYRENHAQKRYSAMTVMLDELEECIPSGINIEDQAERRELIGLVNDYLDGLGREDRVLFVRRYYFGESVKELAGECRCSENQMTQRLLKLRRKLKAFVQKGGYEL